MSDDWKKDPRLSQMDPQKTLHASESGGSGIGEKSFRTATFYYGSCFQGKKCRIEFQLP